MKCKICNMENCVVDKENKEQIKLVINTKPSMNEPFEVYSNDHLVDIANWQKGYLQLLINESSSDYHIIRGAKLWSEKKDN